MGVRHSLFPLQPFEQPYSDARTLALRRISVKHFFWRLVLEFPYLSGQRFTILIHFDFHSVSSVRVNDWPFATLARLKQCKRGVNKALLSSAPVTRTSTMMSNSQDANFFAGDCVD